MGSTYRRMPLLLPWKLQLLPLMVAEVPPYRRSPKRVVPHGMWPGLRELSDCCFAF